MPGTWVEPPTARVLWTPPYWGWTYGAHIFHAGYWGPHVGIYGGSVHVENVYRQNVTVINNTHTSFNGGPNGIRAEATAEQRAFEHESHTPPTVDQTWHFEVAARDPGLAAKNNNGRSAIAGRLALASSRG